MRVGELKREQIELAKKIIIKDEFEKVETIAGVDQAFFDNKIISAIVVCDYKTMEIIEKEYAIIDSEFKYLSGFLCFREGPAIIEAFKKLKRKPDILIVEGHGIAHMRKMGLASYVGLMLDQPTIGVAKSLLYGKIVDRAIEIDKEIRGYELKTKEGSKAIYVSPSYKVSLKSSLEIVKNCLRGKHKLPEPLHLAHRYVSKEKKKCQ